MTFFPFVSPSMISLDLAPISIDYIQFQLEKKLGKSMAPAAFVERRTRQRFSYFLYIFPRSENRELGKPELKVFILHFPLVLTLSLAFVSIFFFFLFFLFCLLVSSIYSSAQMLEEQLFFFLLFAFFLLNFFQLAFPFYQQLFQASLYYTSQLKVLSHLKLTQSESMSCYKKKLFYLF